MRFSSMILATLAALSVFFLFFESCSALSNSAVIADVTTHLPPPHKHKITSSCQLPQQLCATLGITNLQADGGWTPYGNNTISLTSPLGFIGYLMYVSIPDGKHVGTLTLQEGTGQYYNSATPPGSTLMHVNKQVQSLLQVQWTAPPIGALPGGASQSSVTVHVLLMGVNGTGYLLSQGPFQQTTLAFSTPAPAATTAKPTTTTVKTTTAAATTAKPTAAATTTTTTVTPIVNCFIQVPPNPLTYAGLATPYILSKDPTGNQPCTMANAGSQAFVQGAIIDLDTGNVYVYNPIVIDAGTQPAVPVTVPILQPPNFVAATWFGFNGNTLTLVNTPGTTSVADGKCVNGIAGSPFTQFAYCNAPNFFNAVQNAMENGQIATILNQNNGVVTPTVVIPSPGTATADGLPCPTLRDFFMVDMDQSDNLDVTYLLTSTGLIAQNTTKNIATLAKAGTVTTAINPGDNALLTMFVAPAMGCQGNVWAVPDLANNLLKVNALPLSEIQAAMYQGFPQARVPALDPMVLDNNGNPNMKKLNNFRLGVFQYPVSILGQAETSCYCKNMVRVAPARLMNNAAQLANFGSFVAGQNLFQFLVTRFNMAIGAGGLNCAQFGINTCFSITNPNFMPAGHGRVKVYSNEGIEEALNVWHRVPGEEGMIRMHVMGSTGPTTITTDQNALAAYQSVTFTQPEDMDHDLGVGIDVDTFANALVADAITDPGTQNADANQPSSSTSFISSTVGIAVIIGAVAAAVLLVVGIAAWCRLRKRRYEATNSVQMVRQQF